MLNRPRRSLPGFLAPLSMLMVSLFAVGCGEERLYDDPYGFLDLAPFFYDGASLSNPTSALPRDIRPHAGWVNGVRAEYYDFGFAGRVMKRSSSTTPDYSEVHPMYFFFDDRGNPLFSRPIYEERTGIWHMRGGKNVLDPNPVENANKGHVYSVRTRRTLVDRARNTADYQRPIIDRLHNNSDYAGLWQIVEVTVPDGYEPDAIKSYETLKQGIDQGDFKWRDTGKVINCPVLDDRMYVEPTPMYYGVPRPRIELWYRTKQGSCFLANGWETLGDDEFNLYKAKMDGARVQVFDVINYTIGEGTAARSTVVAPVGKMWQPVVTIADQDPRARGFDVRYGSDWLSDSLPKRGHDDPPGYRPVRWMHDLTVSQDPPYEAGTYRNIATVDPAQLKVRGPGDTRWTRNFPLIGVAKACNPANNRLVDPLNRSREIGGTCADFEVAPGVTMECNKWPDSNIAVSDPPPGRTAVELTLAREGGPRCDVPQVTFGRFCAPGIARCAVESRQSADPTFEWEERDPRNTMPDPDDPTKTVQRVDLKKATLARANPSSSATGVAAVSGYACGPAGTGVCYFRCDSDISNSGAPSSTKMDIRYDTPGGPRTYSQTVSYDQRCGGLPGYVCQTLSKPSGWPSIPNRMKVCVRTCSSSLPEKVTEQWCSWPLWMTSAEDGVDNADISQGQTCSNSGFDSKSVCRWDPAFEPRNPATNFVP